MFNNHLSPSDRPALQKHERNLQLSCTLASPYCWVFSFSFSNSSFNVRHWRLSNATLQCRQLCDAGRSRAAVISDPTPFTCLRSTLVCRKFPDRDIFQLRPFTRHCCRQGGRVGVMNDTLHHARGDLLPEQIRPFQAMSVVKIEQSLREALEQMQ